MSVFLCGNTGFVNRGCEAIVTSTVDILPFPRNEIYLTSYKPDFDSKTAERLGVSLIPYGSYPTSLHRLVCGTIKRLLPSTYCGEGLKQKELFGSIKEGDVCLNIGGDTYCYGRPVDFYALNRCANKKGAKSILWCCSIGKEYLTGETLRDMRRYSLIFAREKLTYDLLIEKGISKEKIVKCCDPAFFLEPIETTLPEGFAEGNTVGINVSDLVIKERGDVCWRSIVKLIKHILSETGMSVCLIPHVYTADPPGIDLKLLGQIRDEIGDERVSLVEDDLDCGQLKYIISKCRFTVASRTHASIAAYSSLVPTLVIGYSVKSRGIATDLFGSYDGFVIPYKDIKDDSEVLSAFLRIVSDRKSVV